MIRKKEKENRLSRGVDIAVKYASKVGGYLISTRVFISFGRIFKCYDHSSNQKKKRRN